jgi:hypothetical protein
MSTYTEKVIWTLLKSSFTKKSFCYLLISLSTIILRIHVDSIIAFLLTTPSNTLNFIIRMIISTILILNTKYFYDIIQRYEPEYYSIVRYLINNYNDKNFKKWKKKANIFICIYIFLLTFIIDITNNNVRQMIIEYILCYYIIETYENYINGNLYLQTHNKIYECNNHKKDNEIIEELLNKDNEIIEELLNKNYEITL